MKEAIFNILGAPPTSARALDLYAGSGALGLEALSRGCAEAVFVERSEPALTALRQNVKELGLEGRARISSGEALREAARMSRHGERFGWIFLDPPYAAGVLEQALSAVAPLCAEDTTVIAEHDVHHEPEAAVGPLSRSDRRRYGDTCVSFYRSEREAA